MARADLSAMLGRLGEESTGAGPSGDSASKSTSTETGGVAPTATAGAGGASDPDAGIPRYRRLERKETRLRADQYERLTIEARRLSRAKGAGGERITENTLIRVAIDLLLLDADRLAGSTEDEIRESVTS